MKKNLVIVGYGGMGGWHANHAQKSDVVNLLGVYDIKPERTSLARERGIFAYDSLEDVLNDDRVDLITIVTPNDVHREIAVKAMKAGKNVISEKPVAMSVDELREMISVSEETGKLFTVHQNRRWDAEYLMMKEVYDSGRLGPIFGIQSIVYGSRGIPGDWRGHKKFGGGMILDWGVHLIDQILCIVGDLKLKSIYCHCEHVTNYEVDDGFKLDMTFENGLVARVEVGTSHFIKLPRFYMAGENGSAIIPDWNQNCKIVACTNWNAGDAVPIVTAAGLTKTMAPRTDDTIEEFEIVKPDSDVHDFYRNAVKAIDGKEPQLITHKQLLRVMRIIEACFESDKLGQVLDFED